jgi:hypothetical protein
LLKTPEESPATEKPSDEGVNKEDKATTAVANAGPGPSTKGTNDPKKRTSTENKGTPNKRKKAKK